MADQKNSKVLREVKRYFFMVVACVFYAVAIDVFFVPHNIVAGGVSGFSTMLNIVTGIGVGVFTILINIPILLLGLKSQGLRFILRCFLTTAVLSLTIDALSFLPSITDNPLLAALYGAVAQGVAIGLFYRYNVSSGGTELLARVLLPKMPGASMGSMLALLDGVVVITGSIVLKNPENVLLALMVIIINAKISDMVISGMDYAKMCYIITEKADQVSGALLAKSPRGVTSLGGTGMYTRTARNVLMTVIKKQQLTQLRQIVQETDPAAFVIVSETTEVLGQGFHPIVPPSPND